MEISTTVNFSNNELLQIIINDEEGNILLIDLLQDLHKILELDKYQQSMRIISQILEKYLNEKGYVGSIMSINFLEQKITLQNNKPPVVIQKIDLSEVKIVDLKLYHGNRALTIFKKFNIKNLKDLQDYLTNKDNYDLKMERKWRVGHRPTMFYFRNFGLKSLNDFEDALKKLSLKINEDGTIVQI